MRLVAFGVKGLVFLIPVFLTMMACPKTPHEERLHEELERVSESVSEMREELQLFTKEIIYLSRKVGALNTLEARNKVQKFKKINFYVVRNFWTQDRLI